MKIHVCVSERDPDGFMYEWWITDWSGYSVAKGRAIGEDAARYVAEQTKKELEERGFPR